MEQLAHGVLGPLHKAAGCSGENQSPYWARMVAGKTWRAQCGARGETLRHMLYRWPLTPTVLRDSCQRKAGEAGIRVAFGLVHCKRNFLMLS